MLPTPSSTASSAGPHSPDGQYRVVRKRNRIPLSCGPCRHRKLKCNRAHPCENCVKRGDAPSCTYSAPGTRRKNQSSHGLSTSDEMQSRIDRLEGLVLSLMTNGAPSAGPAAAAAALARDARSASKDAPQDTTDTDSMVKEEESEDESDVDDVTNSLGVMKVDANKSMYVGESHWAAVLNDISFVKNHFKGQQKEYEEQLRKLAASKFDDDIRTPAFLFNTSTPVDKDELLASLPPRPAVDKIVARYLNSCDPCVHILHAPSFQEEYEEHWLHPSKTSVTWLGQLFALMSLAMYSYHRAGEEPPEYKGKGLQLSNVYKMRTMQAMVLTDFCRPATPLIETLLLHLQGEWVRSHELSSWVLGSTITRLAMHMGYHRDPKHYTNITPFQGEVRRRVWTFLRMVDLLLSFQVGLPSMIRSGHCDTALPRNLYDEEFGKGIAVLPPSRPVTEATPVSYMIAKARMAFVFGDIVEETNSVHAISYDEVMKLDKKIREARAMMPPHLRMRPIEDSRMDPANLIMQRVNLELLFLRGLCVLHRSSLELLRYQITLHHESLPHARLWSVRWFIPPPSSGIFVLAALIIALDLYHETEAEVAGATGSDIFTWSQEERAEMMQALEAANVIWREYRDQCYEAYKANELITVMLERLTKPGTRTAAMSPDALSPFSFGGLGGLGDEASPSFAHDDGKPEHTAAMTLGMLSSGGVPPGSAAAAAMYDRSYPFSPSRNLPVTDSPGPTLNYPADPAQSASGDFNASLVSMLGQPSNQLMDMPANFDWDAWDAYIQSTTNLDSPNQSWPAAMDLLPGGIAPSSNNNNDGLPKRNNEP